MPRTVSQETLEKIEYVKSLYAADRSITRRELNDAVKKKFKTGLAFGHMANVLEGGRRAPETTGKKGGAAVAGSGRLVAPGKSAVYGRLIPVSDRIFASSPAFLIVVGGRKALGVRVVDTKAAVKEEIARLVSGGTLPGQIRVYSRDVFSVETRPIVNMD